MQNHLLAPHPLAVEQYRALFAEHGDSIKALGWPDQNRCDIRYKALCRDIERGANVLDYGCGLGHLLEYLQRDARCPGNYLGVDVVPEFIDACANNGRYWPAEFRHIIGAGDITEDVAHIVCCGVFSYLCLPVKQHELHVQATLAALYAKCTVALHVDFLAPDPAPEYHRPDLFNMSLHTLINWAKAMGCTRYEIDRSYLPFEYCVHFYRPQEILRPANMFVRAL